MPDNLRTRIEAAIRRNSLATDLENDDGELIVVPVGNVVDAVVEVVEKSLWNAANTNYGKCNSCNALVLEGWARPNRPVQPHKMTCRWYVGPVEHRLLRTTYNSFWNVDDYECTCGRTWREGDETGCPNTAETRRGPKPEDAP